MGPTDPRVLIDLLHEIGDRIRRAAQEGHDLLRDTKWLQTQAGEWASGIGHAARNAIETARSDHQRATEAAALAARVEQELATARDEVRDTASLVSTVQRQAGAAVADWSGRVERAEEAVRAARAQRDAALARLAACRQPVYGRGPNGQVVVRHRDCSAYEHGVAQAERELGRATADLERCRRGLGRARQAAQGIAEAAPYLELAQAELEEGTTAARRAVGFVSEARKAAGAEVAAGEEVVRLSAAAAEAVRTAGQHAHRAEQDCRRGEAGAHNAAGDLARRIDNLEAFNRPRPLPE